MRWVILKIDTSISKNYFVIFDEARGVAIHKKSVLKNRKSKTLSYTQGKIIVFVLLFLSSLLFAFFCKFNCYMVWLYFLTYLITIIYLAFAVISTIEIYSFREKRGFKNTILIDENGITDESYYGIKMMFKWEKITGVVIGKRAITVLTDTPVYFYFDISKKEDIIKAVEKYGNKDLIIE